MDAIDELYLREKHNGLRYYDTLRLTFLLHIEYLYSHNEKSEKSIDDLTKELGIKKVYKDDELGFMIEAGINILKVKYNIEVININPLCYKKRKDWKNEKE